MSAVKKAATSVVAKYMPIVAKNVTAGNAIASTIKNNLSSKNNSNTSVKTMGLSGVSTLKSAVTNIIKKAAEKNHVGNTISSNREKAQLFNSLYNVRRGESFTQSVAAMIEQMKCAAYDTCRNFTQEIIFNTTLAVGAVPGDMLHVVQSGIKVQNGNDVFYIPEEVRGTIQHIDTGEIEEKTLKPVDNWGLPGKGGYQGGVQINEEGRYEIAVGPKILNPDYPDDGKIWDTDFEENQRINLIVENRKSGLTETIECVVVDLKAHTYNQYPEGHENDTLPYAVSFDVENGIVQTGIVQTGIAYPNSVNAEWEDAFAYENIDGSVIEFAGHEVDFDINDYILKKIIVVQD